MTESYKYKNDTIFALSTVMGKSGVAVFRISGADSYKISDIFDIKTKFNHRYSYFCKLKGDEGDIIDEVLLIKFDSPNSFTGEDVIEIHTHGSVAVISVVSKMLSSQFRMAGPGEFSKRAFLNNKMDLVRAEGVADIIDAETEMQLRQASRQMSGELGNLYTKWRKKLIHCLAFIEAHLDFPDEEIPANVLDNVSHSIEELKKDISAHVNDKSGEIIRNGLYISILGSPNAGKSSLMNSLTKREVSIVSEHQGTTRDVIEVNLNIGGYFVTIADTAGIRKDAENIIEAKGINRAISASKESDLKIILFDIHKLDSMDNSILNLIDEKSVCVASKADFLKDETVAISTSSVEMIPISSYRGFGIDRLINVIKNKVMDVMSKSESVVFTRERHRIHLCNALDAIDRVDIINMDAELAAEDLRLAAAEIGKITGIITVEDILDEVFSNFCIGK